MEVIQEFERKWSIPEEWRDISGTKDYQVSEIGNVRRKVGSTYKVVNPKFKTYPYKRVQIRMLDNTIVPVRVRDLVKEYYPSKPKIKAKYFMNKPIRQFLENGYKDWTDSKEAAMILSISEWDIGRVCLQLRCRAGGFVFRFI